MPDEEEEGGGVDAFSSTDREVASDAQGLAAFLDLGENGKGDPNRKTYFTDLHRKKASLANALDVYARRVKLDDVQAMNLARRMESAATWKKKGDINIAKGKCYYAYRVILQGVITFIVSLAVLLDTRKGTNGDDPISVVRLVADICVLVVSLVVMVLTTMEGAYNYAEIGHAERSMWDRATVLFFSYTSGTLKPEPPPSPDPTDPTPRERYEYFLTKFDRLEAQGRAERISFDAHNT